MANPSPKHIAALLLASAAVLAGPALGYELQQEVSYYSVSGVDMGEVITQMNRRGPQADDGQLRWALTDSKISWSYQLQHSGEQCTALAPEVELLLRMRLPQWTNAADASLAAQDNWMRLKRVLQQHEDGHAAIARDCAAQIEAKLAQAVTAEKCSAAAEQLSAAGDAIIARCEQAHQAYDQQTLNGYLQGMNIE